MKHSTNIWEYKPWWCQPWSILLTGVGLISGSWVLLHSIWISIVVSIPVLTWMGFFLLIYPKAMSESLYDSANDRSSS
ncbi:DUF6737 family protein [Leptolyngbya sp. AN03gr2]|uniref:DUF6737 family protein n=1 Tax=unclassified Leptolyngbya TaxID=2650499 RepID=UPI003D30EFD6